MPMALLRVPCRCICPFLPCKHWAFPKRAKGRRVAPLTWGLSRNQTLPVILVWPDSRSCTIRVMLSRKLSGRIWPAPRTGYDPSPQAALGFGGKSTQFPSGPQSDSHTSLPAALRLAQAGPDSTSLLGAVSGQVRPVCYHTNPPPACSSKRASDETTSFHVVR